MNDDSTQPALAFDSNMYQYLTFDAPAQQGWTIAGAGYQFPGSYSYIADPTLETGFGTTAEALTQIYKSTEEHFKQPVTRKSVIDRFYDLALTWQHDHMFTSDMDRVAMHPAYQQIIGMGNEVLPLIFQQLQFNPNYWFAALNAITGVNPVKEDHLGNLQAMSNDWVEWATRKGYVDGQTVYTTPLYISQ
jgi:hypothetical protein